ncbi:hypothetical protein BGZ80_004405 [Entomortierella chlamydospora]|uniref:Uncharacterized protein n=1 Tax=Entomortierella chlamydospora TaxID=101097 RepID=A0A9P6T2Q7_9FUNG|nr:hypothetical protein BGZ79_005384 [Entomortierella chlamydospora]KAG0020317.1 hypothetical protein BGZ80_004405 [Entomortierella chlamydospora]
MAYQITKDQKKAIKETIKSIEHDYKTKVREAEKKCNSLREEADKVAERERAAIKAKKEKADKEAKDEYQKTKSEASEIHIQLVMDLVRNVILDIQSKNLEQRGHLSRTCSTSSASSSSCCNGSSSASKEDAEIKEWVEYATDRLEGHMPRAQVRQRLLEEVASGALIRQHQAQQEAMRKTDELQRQLDELRLLQTQLQQQQQQQQQAPNYQNGQATLVGMAMVEDSAPPAYVSAVGSTEIDVGDYGKTGSKK